jgi:geranylgeranyl pyrophosphate synthase
MQITRLKSGSLGRLATSFAANIATEESQTIKLFEEFGFNLFTYMQLVDDLRDACPENTSHTDFGQHKKTLPLVYFSNFLAEDAPVTNSGIMSPDSGVPISHEVRQAFKTSGAEVFSAIVAETFLNRAKSNLADLRDRVIMVESLEQLVSSVEFNPNEIMAVS